MIYSLTSRSIIQIMLTKSSTNYHTTMCRGIRRVLENISLFIVLGSSPYTANKDEVLYEYADMRLISVFRKIHRANSTNLPYFLNFTSYEWDARDGQHSWVISWSLCASLAITSALQHTATHCNTLQHTATTIRSIIHIPCTSHIHIYIWEDLLNFTSCDMNDSCMTHNSPMRVTHPWSWLGANPHLNFTN